MGRVRAGVRGASAAERRPVYGGESATPCLPRSAPLPFRAHSYPPAPLDAREPPARTYWQHRMQTCFVNGCGSDRGRACLSVFFYYEKFYKFERDGNGGATCYRLPLAAFFHAKNEARLLPKATYTCKFLYDTFLSVAHYLETSLVDTFASADKKAPSKCFSIGIIFYSQFTINYV